MQINEQKKLPKRRAEQALSKTQQRMRNRTEEGNGQKWDQAKRQNTIPSKGDSFV